MLTSHLLSPGSRTVTPYNDSGYDPVELGASIFVDANKVGLGGVVSAASWHTSPINNTEHGQGCQRIRLQSRRELDWLIWHLRRRVIRLRVERLEVLELRQVALEVGVQLRSKTASV